jgi:class 3 adenylate cyclase
MFGGPRSRLASWLRTDTADGMPHPPPRVTLPPRVIDVAVVGAVALLYAGFLLTNVYIHAGPNGRPRMPSFGPADWDVHAVLGVICFPAVFALWWRRDHSIRVLGIALVTLVVAYPYSGLFAIVALYSAVLRVSPRAALICGAAAALGRFVGGAIHEGSIGPSNAVPALTTAGVTVVAGLYVAARRAYMARLRERALFARALASFLPPQVAKLVEESPSSLSLTAELEATVLFCDIRGFSTIAERLNPRQVADIVGRYVSAMAEVITRHGGTVDKFAGDAVMALFGVPIAMQDQAEQAIRCAIAMRRRLTELDTEGWPGDVPRLEIGIGINSGAVVAGTLGGVGRLDYTVLGDAVNVAQRLQSEATAGEILVSAATIERARWADAEPIGERALKGRNEPVEVFKIPTLLAASGPEQCVETA